jgi:phosphatidate cytidylyltransferase
VTGLAFISLIILAFFAPTAYSHVLFLLFALLATQEYFRMVAKSSEETPLLFTTCLSIISLLAAFQLILYSKKLFIILILITLLSILITFAAELYRKKANPLQNIALSLLPLFWIALPFAIASIWMNYFSQKNLVLALFIIIWLYDTFAYCIGSLIGKHKLFARISPKKSWEGFIGSLILTVTMSVLFYYIPYFKVVSFTSPIHWIIFSILIIVAATFGDFVESCLKRSVDVKDSGNILPGHGGILDRFDSFFFATPIAFAFWIITLIK